MHAYELSSVWTQYRAGSIIFATFLPCVTRALTSWHMGKIFTLEQASVTSHGESSLVVDQYENSPWLPITCSYSSV